MLFFLVLLASISLACAKETNCGQQYDKCVRNVHPKASNFYAQVTGIFSSERDLCVDALRVCKYLNDLSNK